MANKCNKYLIMATGNDGSRRTLHSYKTKSEATKQMKIILSKPKGNKTSYRNAQSGTGINNPRIKKIRGYC
jgi:hypothetical protein